MANFAEIPLELQLSEAHCHIREHQSKGQKFPQFLSPAFLWCFPAIMDNHMSVQWDDITCLFDRSQQHSRCALAMIHNTLAISHKGKPVMVYGASFVYIPAYQSQAGLGDALKYLAVAKEDCVVLVSTPMHQPFSPEPRQCLYYRLLPINGDPCVDRGPLQTFAAATLLKASWEGWPDGMVTVVKLPPCYGSSKRPNTELMEEMVLARGPLWKNVNYVEHRDGKIVHNNLG